MLGHPFAGHALGFGDLVGVVLTMTPLIGRALVTIHRAYSDAVLSDEYSRMHCCLTGLRSGVQPVCPDTRLDRLDGCTEYPRIW